MAYSNYAHQALSIDICHPVSPPSITDLDENCTNRDFSPRSDKRRLSSSARELVGCGDFIDIMVVLVWLLRDG